MESDLIVFQIQGVEGDAIAQVLNLYDEVIGELKSVQTVQQVQARDLLNSVLLQVECKQQGALVEAFNFGDTIAFPVEALEFGEKVHVFNAFKTLVMEVKLLIQFKRAVVHFPLFLEVVEDPLAGASADGVLIVGVSIALRVRSFPALARCVVLGVNERGVAAAVSIVQRTLGIAEGALGGGIRVAAVTRL